MYIICTVLFSSVQFSRPLTVFPGMSSFRIFFYDYFLHLDSYYLANVLCLIFNLLALRSLRNDQGMFHYMLYYECDK